MTADHTAMERNIRLYPWYVFFRDCFFWGPVFFLYFSSRLNLAQAIQLEGIYYISVVIFEVPSGYLSDVWGRRRTLLLSCASLGSAYLLFLIGQTYWQFALAQVLLAFGFAAASGTDTALHYESLVAVGRGEEYQEREAVAARAGFLAGGAAAVLGGLFACGALRFAYGATLATCAVAGAFTLLFREPERARGGKPDAFMEQVGTLFKKSWSRRLRFFTVFSIGMIVLLHIPYEFYQPFIKEVLPSALAGRWTPLILGLHLALTMGVGAIVTRYAGRIQHRCRVRVALLGCVLLQVLLMAGMALLVHPVMALLLTFRTASKGLSRPLVNAEIAPLLEDSERSTFLSLQSLMGRLSHGLVMLLLPLAQPLHANPLTGSLLVCVVLGLALLALLCRTPFPRGEGACCHDHEHPGVLAALFGSGH